MDSFLTSSGGDMTATVLSNATLEKNKRDNGDGFTIGRFRSKKIEGKNSLTKLVFKETWQRLSSTHCLVS